MSDQYHHGNLRNSLIEAGIQLVNEQGVQHFSLRKVASLCNVSHAAPYSHFKSKEELFDAMQVYVIELFMTELQASQEGFTNKKDVKSILNMGKAYVQFFIRHPQYYSFLFYQTKVELNLTITKESSEKLNGDRRDSKSEVTNDSFQPLELLKQTAEAVFADSAMSEEQIQDQILALWSTVHGLAGIATMPHVVYDKKWEEKIEDIIWHG